jgi:hypothetical protein
MFSQRGTRTAIKGGSGGGELTTTTPDKKLEISIQKSEMEKDEARRYQPTPAA